MWLAPKAKHFEPIEHNCFYQMVLKMSFCLIALSFKISRLWKFWVILFFIKFIQWTCTFIKGGMFLLYKKFEINCMIVCLPFGYFFKKMYFRHLIPLVYKTQEDINIIYKLFLNIFINLKRHHFIYGIQQSITIIIM